LSIRAKFLYNKAMSNDIKIRNEVLISSKLDNLHMDLHTATRKAANFIFNLIGAKTRSRQQWEEIGKLIEESQLDPEVQEKLVQRHQLLYNDGVKPEPKPLAYALVPIALLWFAKSVIMGKMQERKFEKMINEWDRRRRPKRRR